MACPELNTPRLLLRQLQPEDKQAVFQLRSDARVNRYLDRPAMQKAEEAGAFMDKINAGIRRGEWFYWAITLKGNPELVGTICIWNFSVDRKTAELGYELIPRFQKQGIMKEALKQVIEYAFQVLQVDTLEAFTHAENEASLRLLESFSFKADPGRVDAENPSQIIYTLARL